MPEPNDTATTPLPNIELCTIRIVFPANSDEEAIIVKKKIKEILSDRPDAQFHFNMMSPPLRGLPNASV